MRARIALAVAVILSISTTARAQQAKGTCAVESIRLQAPIEGSTLYTQSNFGRYRLELAAEVDCPADVSQVEFFVRQTGDFVTAGVDMSAPYAVGIFIQDPILSQPLEARAVATRIGAGGTIQHTVQFRFGDASAVHDADLNGIPDQPFSLLTRPGDRYRSAVTMPGAAAQMISATAVMYGFNPDANPDPNRPTGAGTNTISLALPIAENPGQTLTVSASERILRANEVGLLIVQAAATPEALFGAGATAFLNPLPTGHFDDDAFYAEVSLIVTTNRGAGFEELRSGRLNQFPIEMTLSGLPLESAGRYTLASHGSQVALSGGRLVIRGETGVWRSVSGAQVDTTSGTISASLTSLSVFAPFTQTTTGEGEGEGECEGEECGPTGAPPELTILLIFLLALGMLQLAEGGLDGPCFIATAAYGTPLAAELDTFRSLRDDWLLQHPAGMAFVDLYYHLSPALADSVAAQPLAAAGVRLGLMPLLLLARLLLANPAAFALGAAALATGLGIHQKRRTR